MSRSRNDLICEYGHLEKVHFLTNLPLDYKGEYTRVYRYMQYPDLTLSLQNKSFAFMTPNKWEDLYERRFWDTDYSLLNPFFKKPEFACLCITPENRDDSAASWKMYCKEPYEKLDSEYDNNLVRLSLDFPKFIDALNTWAIDHKSEVYISAVDYSFSQTELCGEIRYDSQYFPMGFDIEDYFKVLSLKRPYYSFEREIRIFVLEPSKGPKIQNDLLILDDFDISQCITRILVAPIKEGYKKKLDTETVRKEIGSYFMAGNLSNIIQQSNQYKCDPCKKINPQNMENEKMTAISEKSKYKIECNIEQISMDTDNKLRVKLKGIGPYSIKKESKVYNLFHNIEKNGDSSPKSEDESKEESAISDAKLINAKEIIELVTSPSNEKLIEWVRFAFEKEKVIELEFDNVDKNSATITAVAIKS